MHGYTTSARSQHKEMIRHTAHVSRSHNLIEVASCSRSCQFMGAFCGTASGRGIASEDAYALHHDELSSSVRLDLMNWKHRGSWDVNSYESLRRKQSAIGNFVRFILQGTVVDRHHHQYRRGSDPQPEKLSVTLKK